MDVSPNYSRNQREGISNTNMVTSRGSSYYSKSRSSRIDQPLTSSNQNLGIGIKDSRGRQTEGGLKISNDILLEVKERHQRFTVSYQQILQDNTHKKIPIYKQDDESTKMSQRMVHHHRKSLLNQLQVKNRKYDPLKIEQSLLLPQIKRSKLEVIVEFKMGERFSSSDISSVEAIRGSISTDVSSQ